MQLATGQEALFVACEMEASAIQLYSRAISLMEQLGRRGEPLYDHLVLMRADEQEHLSSFPDAADVSSYAVQALNWAVAEGVITGTTEGTLNPEGPATRAQFCVMLWRFVEG